MEGLNLVSILETNNTKKWIMEIGPNRIGVKHPPDYDFEKLPIQTISTSSVSGFEPDEKMENPESAKAVAELAEKIKNGNYDAPPILVREYQGNYQVVDGHHRFHAHKIAGSATINVRVVPAEDIEYIDNR